MWISRKQFAELQAAAASTIAATEALKQHAYLIGLEREGKLNKFTFARGDKLIQIETYSAISDDFGQWKKDLGV